MQPNYVIVTWTTNKFGNRAYGVLGDQEGRAFASKPDAALAAYEAQKAKRIESYEIVLIGPIE